MLVLRFISTIRLTFKFFVAAHGTHRSVCCRGVCHAVLHSCSCRPDRLPRPPGDASQARAEADPDTAAAARILQPGIPADTITAIPSEQ